MNPGKAERLVPFQIPIPLPYLQKMYFFITPGLKNFTIESNQIPRLTVRLKPITWSATVGRTGD
jgi:hypothetical protein